MTDSFDFYIESAMFSLSHSIKVIDQAHYLMNYVTGGLFSFILNGKDCQESSLPRVILMMAAILPSAEEYIC